MDTTKILYELERVWEGSLPGRQAAEFNAALRALWRDLRRQQAAREPARLRLVRDEAQARF
jgi:hypothetical protein